MGEWQGERRSDDGGGAKAWLPCHCGTPIDDTPSRSSRPPPSRIVPIAAPAGSGSSGSGRASGRRPHVLCRPCRQKVERQVWGRFGGHRYGGRFAHEVPDSIQDCYVKLLREGGLDRFRPPEDTSALLLRFRGWLWSVVNNYCNGRLDQLTQTLPPQDRPWDPPAPEVAFQRQFSLTVMQSSIERVQRDWESSDRGEKFRVLIGFIIGDGSTYEDVAQRLNVMVGHARVLVWELRRDLRAALRREVRDMLDLPPGLAPKLAERMIEDEVVAIMRAWSRADDDDDRHDKSEEG